MILDIDLLRLSSTPDDFTFYNQQIRQEYAHSPEDVYNAGRKVILEKFLARPNIYHTEVFKPREIAARTNLETAIHELEKTCENTKSNA